MVNRIAVVGLALASVVGTALPVRAEVTNLSINRAASMYANEYCRQRVQNYKSIEDAVRIGIGLTIKYYLEEMRTSWFNEEAAYIIRGICPDVEKARRANEEAVRDMRNRLLVPTQPVDPPTPPRSVIRRLLEESAPANQ